MTTIPRKAPHPNGIWPHSPQNTCGCHEITKQSMKNHEPKISLEKALDPQQKSSETPNTVGVWHHKPPQQVPGRETHLIVLARGRSEVSCAPTFGTCGIGQNEEGGACGSRARFLTIRLDGEARRQSVLLPVLAVRSHMPSRCMFQKLNPLPTKLLSRMFGISPKIPQF